MHVSPAIQPPANLQPAASLDGRLGQLRHLDAAPIHGAAALAVDDGRHDERGVDVRRLRRPVHEEVVHDARRVLLDDLADLRQAVQVVEDGVAGLTRDEGLVARLAGRQDGGPRDLDPVGWGRYQQDVSECVRV